MKQASKGIHSNQDAVDLCEITDYLVPVLEMRDNNIQRLIEDLDDFLGEEGDKKTRGMVTSKLTYNVQKYVMKRLNEALDKGILKLDELEIAVPKI